VQPVRRFIARFVIAAGLLALTGASASAQTAADLFDDQVLHEVRLFVHSRDLLQLRARYQENIYFPADLVWRGIRIRNVGIRSRGAGSRNPTKLGLRVDFNRYTRNQQFVGLRSLVLDNLYQDPSLLRESLAMSVYRRLGEISPRESFARLYINNQYQGVYLLVEPIDAGFVERSLGERDGYLHEYHHVGPYYTEYLGDPLEPYKARFEPQTHGLEADEPLYGPIRDLFRDVNEPDDAVWRERVEERIDLRQFMAHTAIQAFLAEVDGFLGYDGINNFYLYRYAGTNRHRLFPWDEDFAFAFLDSSLLRQGLQPVVLFDRAFAQPDLRTLFLDIAEECARVVTESGWLAAEIERLYALIAQAVFEDTRKLYSNDDFLAGIEMLRMFAATRTEIVLNEISGLR
jgi:spore coat protein CotH